jgi:hypothetical protein
MSDKRDVPRRRFRVSPTVVDPTVLAARVEAALAEIDPSLVVTARRGHEIRPDVEAADAHLHALAALSEAVVPPETPPVAGISARGRRFVKRLVRRLTHWLYEPRWAVQRQLDLEIAGFSSAVMGVLDQVTAELQRLERDNEALRLELRVLHGQLRRTERGAAEPMSSHAERKP